MRFVAKGHQETFGRVLVQVPVQQRRILSWLATTLSAASVLETDALQRASFFK